MTTENNENELMTEEATNTEGTTVQTAGEENTESGGTDAGTDENLPLADQKKAINLQDLIYVKKYINDQVKAFKNKLISDLTNGTVTVKKATNASTASDAAYAISAERATKDSDGNVIKDTYYKKTDTVANATNATNAKKLKSVDGNNGEVVAAKGTGTDSDKYRIEPADNTKATDLGTSANPFSKIYGDLEGKAKYFVGDDWVSAEATLGGAYVCYMKLVNGATYQIEATHQKNSVSNMTIISKTFTYFTPDFGDTSANPDATCKVDIPIYRSIDTYEVTITACAESNTLDEVRLFSDYNSSDSSTLYPIAFKIRRIS